jgi:hypothetical protein
MKGTGGYFVAKMPTPQYISFKNFKSISIQR